MKIKKAQLTDFIPDENNANKGTERGQKMLQESLREDGAARSIVVDANNNVIAGNKTLENAVDIGIENAVVVETTGDELVVTKRLDWDLYEDEAPRRYAYRDNRSSEVGLDWAPDIVLADIEEGVDLSSLFYESELSDILNKVETPPGEDEPPSIDKAEELRQKYGVKVGQVWRLGRHKICVGDCTDREVVERVMEGERADMVFTDPPYNVGSETIIFAKDAPTHLSAKRLSEADWDKDFDISNFLETLPFVMNNNCSIYICTSHFLISAIWDWMRSISKFYNYCVWCKPNPAPSLSKRQWTWATELIAYAVIGKHTFNYPNGSHALNWWEITAPRHITEHPTEKPIAIPERAIIRSSTNNDMVYDPFLGSGTTLIACEQLNRQCRAIELDPGYVGVCLQRFFDHTGVEPVLLSDGNS